jgi:cytoskeletal protein CcmA (bactofilin family)
MNTENGKIEGDVEITFELKMHGMFLGNVTVKNGGYLILHGMATKSLVVEPGAAVEIFGMVIGNVINNGGKLFIAGRVNGQIIENAGITNISDNASIG